MSTGTFRQASTRDLDRDRDLLRDQHRRRDLLDGLLDALRSLKAAGCGAAYLDGSFVTTQGAPR
jgi:hypothetical protein